MQKITTLSGKNFVLSCWMLVLLVFMTSPAMADLPEEDPQACVVGQSEWTLIAGQNIDAGIVSAVVNGDNLDVTFTTHNGWELTEAHLWVGMSLDDMPQTRRGNPIPGQFPYNSGDITGATTHTFSVPLDGLGFSCPMDDKEYFLAAHAAVQKFNSDTGETQTETGWSEGDPINDRGNWGMVSKLTLSCTCDQGDPPGQTCNSETAFAYSGTDADTCFLDLDEDMDGNGDFNRWGWTVGPLAPGDHTFTLHSGAGQCDRTKGSVDGTVDVSYDGATVNFTYVPDPLKTNLSIDEVHFYAGCELLPRNKLGFFTVSPGQYPVVQEDGTLSGSLVVPAECAGGDIYVVAHAVTTVCTAN